MWSPPSLTFRRASLSFFSSLSLSVAISLFFLFFFFQITLSFPRLHWVAFEKSLLCSCVSCQSGRGRKRGRFVGLINNRSWSAHKRGCNCYSVDEEERKFGLHFFSLSFFFWEVGDSEEGKGLWTEEPGCPWIKARCKKEGGFEVCQEV